MFELASQEIEEFHKNFDLQLVNPEELQGKEKRRIYWKDLIAQEEQKAEQRQAEKLKLGGERPDDDVVKEISSVNPIADFTKMINDRKTDRVGDAIAQMQKLIERFVTHSLKGDLFDKALECMKTLREACVKEDEAPSFNKFAERIKALALRTSNESFFGMMAEAKLTLITKHESSISSIVEQ